MLKTDPFSTGADTVTFSDDTRFNASASSAGDSAYVPSAFRRRRSARDRARILEDDPGDVGDAVLFPGEPWDAEVWDLGAGRPRRRRSGGIRAVALLGLALGAAFVYAQRFEPELLADLIGAATGSGAGTAAAVQAERAPTSDAAGVPDVDEGASGPEPADAAVVAEAPEAGGETTAGGSRTGGTAQDPVAATRAEEPTDGVAPSASGAAPAESRPTPTPQAPAREEPVVTPAPQTPPAPTPGAPATTVPPPAEATGPPGTLSVQSYPWGAVYIDGEFVGNSPILDHPVPAGTREVRVERPGYETYVGLVTIEPDEDVLLAGVVLTGVGR